MKKLLIAALCLIILPLYASVWEDNGLSVESSSANEQGQTKTNLKDKDGKSFSVLYSSEINDIQLKTLLGFKKEIEKWDNFSIQNIQFFVSERRIEILITPSEFTVEREKISVPAGVVFFIDKDAVKYDFRILKDYLPIKIRGVYMNQQELAGKIARALKNPYAFIQMNEPDYYLAKVDETEKELAALKKEVENTKTAYKKELEILRTAVIYYQNEDLIKENPGQTQKAIQRILTLKKKNSQMTSREIEATLKQEGLKLSKNEIRLILAVYLNVFE